MLAPRVAALGSRLFQVSRASPLGLVTPQRPLSGVHSSPERVLVTGGQGLLGCWIIRELLAGDNRVEVLSVDNSINDHLVDQILEPSHKPLYARETGDISKYEFVDQCFRAFRPNFVIHCAALQIPTCRSDPLLGAMVNVQGTLNVFEAVRKLKTMRLDHVHPIVYASSAAVHGVNNSPNPDTPIPDDACPTPTTHYGVYKAANESNAKIFWRDHGVKSIGLRPHTVFGVGREVGITSGPSLALKAIASGVCSAEDPFEISFSGKTSFNWVQDLARIFVQCSRSERQLDQLGGAVALNIKGHVLTAEEYIQILKSLRPGDHEGKVRSGGATLPVAYAFDESGLEQLLGEKPVALTPMKVV